MNNKHLIRTLVVWILVIISIRIASLFDSIPFIYDNLATMIAVLLIYPPVILSIIDKKRITHWQLTASDFKKNLMVFLTISIIIFPIAFLGNHLYQNLFFNTSYHEGSSKIWGFYLFIQLALVAFPEEFFFRGFLQGTFTRIWVTDRKIFGVNFGWAQIFTALIFALSHSLITLQWWHGFIFFPGLVFSWLKEKTGTIWAAVLFHWSCNIFAYWVAIHY